MFKYLVLSVLLSSSLYAQVDYEHCSESTKNLFQVAKIEGHNLPNLFTIDDSGKLLANSKHAKLLSFEETGKVQKYKFSTSTEKRSLLRLFRKKGVKVSDLSYSFEVHRDSKGRIKSITHLPECADCKNDSILEFTYIKDDCVPSQLVTKNLDGESTIAVDSLVCRAAVQREKDLISSMRRGTKCIDELSSYYTKTIDSAQRALDHLKDEEDKLADSTRSPLISRLERTIKLSKKLAKPLTNYGSMENEQFDIRTENAKTIAECFKNLGESYVKENKYFSKTGGYKKEDRPRLPKEDEPVAIEL